MVKINDNLVDIKTTPEGALKVNKVLAPVTPVAIIDGVQYFHKKEFNILELLDSSKVHRYNILTGEEVNSSFKPVLSVAPGGPGFVVDFWVASLMYDGYGIWSAFYTSSKVFYSCTRSGEKPFTVVNSQAEVTDNDKIYLPGCTAYYGYFASDGSKFISYWNEEGEIAVNPVTGITDGVNSVNIQDARIEYFKAEDEGKVLTINAQGKAIPVKPETGLPSVESASVGSILMLDNNKKPFWNSSSSLSFKNVEASNWVSDSTYTGYNYKCVLSTPGITENSYVIVSFDVVDAISGNYAPVCLTGQNTVTIYGSVNIPIVIPSIIEVR